MAYEITPSVISDRLEDSVSITIDDGDRISYFRHDIKDNPVKVLGVNRLGIIPVFEPTSTSSIEFLEQRSKLEFEDNSAVSTILKMRLVNNKPHIDAISTRFKPCVDVCDTIDNKKVLVSSPYLHMVGINNVFKMWDDSGFDINKDMMTYKGHNYYKIASDTDIHVFDRLLLTTRILCATFDSEYEKTNLQIEDVLTAVKSRITKIMSFISIDSLATYFNDVKDNNSWHLLQLIRPRSGFDFAEKNDAYWFIDNVIKLKIDPELALVTNVNLKMLENMLPETYHTNFIGAFSAPSTFTKQSTYKLFNEKSETIAELEDDVVKELILKITKSPDVFSAPENILVWDHGKIDAEPDLLLTYEQKLLMVAVMCTKIHAINMAVRNICDVIHDLVYAELIAWHEMLAGNFAVLITDDDEFNQIKTSFNEVFGTVSRMGAMIGIAENYSTEEIAKARKLDSAYEYLYNVWYQQLGSPEYKDRYNQITVDGTPGECAYFLPTSFFPGDYIYFPYRLETRPGGVGTSLQTATAGALTRIIPLFTEINSTPEKAVSGSLAPYYWDSIGTILADKDVVDRVTANLENITLIISSIISNAPSAGYFESDELIDKLIKLMVLCNFSSSTPEFVTADIKKRLETSSSDDRIKTVLPTIAPNIDLQQQLIQFQRQIKMVCDVFNSVNKSNAAYSDPTYDLLEIHKMICQQIGTIGNDFDYFAALKPDPNSVDKINILLPLFAFDSNTTPTKCVGTKYNMCVIIHPEDEFKLITDEGSYTKWGDGSAATPTNPMIVKMSEQIKAWSQFDNKSYYDDFVKYQKLYHSGSAAVEGSDVIKGSQIFGNQQKMLPFSVICIKK